MSFTYILNNLLILLKSNNFLIHVLQKSLLKTYLRVVILLELRKLKNFLSFLTLETTILNSFLFFLIVCVTVASLDFSIFGYIFLFIKTKFCLETILGSFFPFLLFSLLFIGIQIIIIVMTIRNNLLNFRLNNQNVLIIEQVTLFIFSIPFFGLAIIIRCLRYLQRNPYLKYSVFGTTNKSLASPDSENILKTKAIEYNDYFHPNEIPRVKMYGSMVDSRGNLPERFKDLIYGKALFNHNKTPTNYDLVTQATKQLSADRFDTLSYLFRVFPERFVNVKLIDSEGLPLFNPITKSLNFTKSGKVMKNVDTYEVFSPLLREIVRKANLPDVITYKALLDHQMQRHVIKYREECRMFKFLGALGDNLVEFGMLLELKRQSGLFIDVLEYEKPEASNIDLQHINDEHEKFQFKFISFSNRLQELKVNLDNENQRTAFCRTTVEKVKLKYLDEPNLIVVFDLRASTEPDSRLIIKSIQKMYPELQDRIKFIKPLTYPVCNVEDKITLINIIQDYVKNGGFY
jgi:hypothetical protein